MSERNGKPNQSPDAEDARLSKRLRDLDRRLDESRAARDEVVKAENPPDRPGMATALRLSSEFVAGVVLGAAIGWGVDSLFGTSPWGLIVFLLLGFGAGVLTVMRSAGLVKQPPGSGDDFGTK